jgi:hypothetical protein
MRCSDRIRLSEVYFFDLSLAPWRVGPELSFEIEEGKREMQSACADYWNV